MGRALEPEDRISHYRVVGPLGAGGMGEVYIAKDETLERSVALKVLPPRLVRNEERVRRFVTEAKSASSLNHPNIVTIYEIGHEEVRGGQAGDQVDADSEPIHFISMELVSGETLGQKIHGEQADLKSLVGYLAQAAEGIAKAHAAGIVHRDLKPGNIMVTTDGFAKVLDFGLAKLTERQAARGEALSNAPTEGAPTDEGVILGTVGYMSPEQVQGKGVDHRSDVFSLGCILYEAAARKRPFVADTDVEVMHQILRDQPQSVEEINPAVPAEIRRIIRRCLAKSPDRRFQSMKDVAIELREVVEEWDHLSASATSASGGSGVSGALGVAPEKSRAFWAVIGAALVLGVAGLAFGIYSRLAAPPAPTASPAAPDLKISILMSGNDFGIQGGGPGSSGGAVLSADGRYLAYTTVTEGRTSLNVRQIRTGSVVEIVPSQPLAISGISFSPDGDYLHYLNRDPEHPGYSALFRVPSLGGAPRKLSFDVDSAATFSPDAKRICFRRGRLQTNEDSLVVADADGQNERELIRIQAPLRFAANPAWSPDGKRIAIGLFRFEGGVRAWITTVDVATGRSDDLGTHTWTTLDSLGWTPEGDAVIVSAFVFGAEGNQLYRVAWPGGDVERLTSDLSGYTNVSVAGSGNDLAAVRTSNLDNIWVAPADGSAQAAQVTSSTSSANSMGFARPLPDGGIAVVLPQGDRTVLARMKQDGSDLRILSSQGQAVFWAEPAGPSGIVFAQVEEGKDPIARLWRIDADGSDPRPLTGGAGVFPQGVSSSGDVVLFSKWEDPRRLWALRADGGEPSAVSDTQIGSGPRISPDGRQVLFSYLEGGEGSVSRTRYQVAPIAGGAALASFGLPPGLTRLDWSPDGAGVTYIDRNAGWNVYRHPLGDGKAEALTHFDSGRVPDFRWSPDGHRVAFVREVGKADSLWVMDPATQQTRQVAEFNTGNIRLGLRWTWDSKKLVFRHGTTSQDVVLFSGF